MKSGSVRLSILATNIFKSASSALEASVFSPAAPARIRGSVEAYEAQSEKIISWTQLLGVVIFASLYAVTYSGFSVHRQVEPVPTALALYGGFTLWRLRCAYRGGLSRRQQYASATIDILVLIALIASFPYQYGESAALYLKAPTLFYAFAIIALRTLRFDPGQVLFTGVAAACGWTVLVAIAALDGVPLTGDYREYMRSLSLLPGAELEKLAALLATTIILALSVGRARALLFRTATEEAASADLSKFVGRDAAGRIRASSDGVKSGDGEIRRAAIMFVDLRGFTKATKDLTPRAVIGLLQEYQSRLLPIIERGGGTVDKFLGDGILVSFGASAATERESAMAVNTAYAIVDAVDHWKSERTQRGEPPLDICIALTVGDVVYGAVGHGDRLEFTVIGDPVNLAAKLEKHAKSERARILSSTEAAERAAAQGCHHAPVRIVNDAVVDGAAAPVSLAIFA